MTALVTRKSIKRSCQRLHQSFCRFGICRQGAKTLYRVEINLRKDQIICFNLARILGDASCLPHWFLLGHRYGCHLHNTGSLGIVVLKDAYTL